MITIADGRILVLIGKSRVFKMLYFRITVQQLIHTNEEKFVFRRFPIL